MHTDVPQESMYGPTLQVPLITATVNVTMTREYSIDDTLMEFLGNVQIKQ